MLGKSYLLGRFLEETGQISIVIQVFEGKNWLSQHPLPPEWGFSYIYGQKAKIFRSISLNHKTKQQRTGKRSLVFRMKQTEVTIDHQKLRNEWNLWLITLLEINFLGTIPLKHANNTDTIMKFTLKGVSKVDLTLIYYTEKMPHANKYNKIPTHICLNGKGYQWGRNKKRRGGGGRN